VLSTRYAASMPSICQGLLQGVVRVLGGWVFGAVGLTMVLLLDWCVYMFFAGWTQTTQPGFCAHPGTPAGVGCNS
jgi:hypothetical protein